MPKFVVIDEEGLEVFGPASDDACTAFTEGAQFAGGRELFVVPRKKKYNVSVPFQGDYEVSVVAEDKTFALEEARKKIVAVVDSLTIQNFEWLDSTIKRDKT